MFRYGLYRSPMERGNWWALVNVSVWAVSSGYGEGQLLGTGVCVGMSCIDLLRRRAVGGPRDCGSMGCIERLCRGTVGGHQ
jgi:hypothetical protein